MQVVNGADKPRNGVGTTLPRVGVFVLFVKDKLTVLFVKYVWLFCVWVGLGKSALEKPKKVGLRAKWCETCN